MLYVNYCLQNRCCKINDYLCSMVTDFDLKKAIKYFGYNSVSLAPLLGTSQQATSRAMVNPTLSKLMEICSAIGCTFEELVRAGSDNKTSSVNRSIVCPYCGKELNLNIEIKSEN